MFQTFCQTLFHMTWTAAAAALVVMALRLVLNRKVPRWVICGLWLDPRGAPGAGPHGDRLCGRAAACHGGQ